LFSKEEEGEPKEYSLLTILRALQDKLITGVYNRYGITAIENFLYFNICPKLQVYGLVENTKVEKVAYRRYAMTEKGLQLLAYLQKQAAAKKTPSVAVPRRRLEARTTNS
jgi:hypothetical protein